MKDYYKVLEVDKAASPEVIQKAYRALSMKFHPDTRGRQPTPGNQDHRMRELNEAYETLSDPQRRSRYDAGRITWDVWVDEGLIGIFRNWLQRSETLS